MHQTVRLVALLAVVACKSKQPDPAAKPDESEVERPTDKTSAARETYAKLIGDLETCKLVGYEIDNKCAAAKAFEVAKHRISMKDTLELNAELGPKLLAHRSPTVRVKALWMMTNRTATGSKFDEIVTAAATESDPDVLQAFIRVVSPEGMNPKITELLLEWADHADVRVRLEAIYGIASNRELPGGAEKLLAMAEKDVDPKVREAAAEYGGNLGNPIFLPFYERVTAPPAADKAMYAAAMKGLVNMFHDYPLFATADQAAYVLFLKRMSDKPRTDDAPPWTVTSAFQYYGEDAKLPTLVAWKAKATWFKADVVRQTLAAIIADKQSSRMARNGALTSLIGLGATKAQLAALKKPYDAKNPDDTLVLKKIDEAVAKAK